MEVKKAPSERTLKVIETLETLIALKKVIQCKEINAPEISNLNKSLFDTLIFLLKIKANTIKKRKAINILYHTRDKESIEINEPNIAVNPKMKTIK